MFNKNDVICFLGDSITAAGWWLTEIFENVKNDNIKIFNCGIPGEAACKTLKRIYHDCLIYNPNHIVVKFGMNDVGTNLYHPKCTIANKEQLKKDRLDEFESSMCEIIEICQKSNAIVTLCTPTPYNQIMDTETDNKMANLALDKASEIVFKLAEKYNCKVIDLNKIMNEMILSMDLIQNDRVHPNELGHHVMAQYFMQETRIIKTADYSDNYTMSEFARKRFEAEANVRNISFVEHVLRNQLGIEEAPLEIKKEAVSKTLETRASDEWYISQIKKYLENVDYKNKFIDEFIKYNNQI